MASGLSHSTPGIAQSASGQFFSNLFKELDKITDEGVETQTKRIKDWLVVNRFMNSKDGEFDEIEWARLGHE